MNVRNCAMVAAVMIAVTAFAAEQRMHSEYAQIDGKTGLVTYKGNARLFDENVSIYSDEMVSDYDESGSIEYTRLVGSPAHMEHVDPQTGAKSIAEANEIIYRASAGTIELNGAAKLQMDDSTTHTTVSADRLHLQQQNRRIMTMDAQGLPAKFSRQSGTEAAYEGQAQNVSYRADGELLQLEGSARLTQGNSILEHQTIIHDGVNRRTTLPKREGQENTFILRPKTTKK